MNATDRKKGNKIEIFFFMYNTIQTSNNNNNYL
jgi:hypothetical protein